MASGDTTQGRRLGPGRDLDGVKPGDYWLAAERNDTFPDGVWLAAVPIERQNGMPVLASLGNHMVVEHDDGTITVAPSILVTSGAEDGAPSWHGWLERGVWREA